MTAPLRFADTAAIEARLAARLAIGLAERAQALPYDISERLRVARDQAVAQARGLRRPALALQPAAAPFVIGVSAQGVASAGFGAPWWQRAASLLPLVTLVVGLVLIERHAMEEQVHAAAEVDTLLLADDLPPDAYIDPGFAEFLRDTPPP